MHQMHPVLQIHEPLLSNGGPILKDVNPGANIGLLGLSRRPSFQNQPVDARRLGLLRDPQIALLLHIQPQIFARAESLMQAQIHL